MIIKHDAIKEEMFFEGGRTIIRRTQNVAPIIEDVHRRTASARGKDMFYVGSIPNVDYYAIQREARGDKDRERELVLMFFAAKPKFSTGIKGL